MSVQRDFQNFKMAAKMAVKIARIAIIKHNAIKYYACLMVPYINPANQAPGVQTGHIPGVMCLYKATQLKNLHKSSSLKSYGPELTVCSNV